MAWTLWRPRIYSPPAQEIVSTGRRVHEKVEARSTLNSTLPLLVPSGHLELQDLVGQLASVNSCYSDKKCNYDDSDPKSYAFAIGQDLQRILFGLALKARVEGQVDRTLKEAAVQFLESDDGHVQEGALDLISTQPPSEEALEAILKFVISGFDAELIAHAMAELERYQDPRDLKRINQALGDAMVTGAPFTAQEISSHIEPFLNDLSYQFYKDVTEQVPETSIVQANLIASLNKFLKRKSSG